MIADHFQLHGSAQIAYAKVTVGIAVVDFLPVLARDSRGVLSVNQSTEAHMRRIVAGICSAHGVSAEVSYETIFPATINAAPVAAAATGAAVSLVGAASVDGDSEAKLFSEDFAHMAKARPGCFVLMGNGTEGANARPLHSADYDFSDDALTIGSSFWAALVEQQLPADEA